MRWFGWLRNSSKAQDSVPCQCGHLRCYHSNGAYGCHVGVIGRTFEGKECWAECQCAHYIPSQAQAKEIEILERMMK